MCYCCYVVSNSGRGWHNVVLYPLTQLQQLLVAGYPTATDNRCFVWPMSTTDSVSPSQMHTVTSAVKTVNNTARFVCLGLELCIRFIVVTLFKNAFNSRLFCICQ